MIRIGGLLGQIVAYTIFMALVGYFSTSPAYTHISPDQAVIKLSFAHYGQIVGECRERTDEELAKLPPNMRVRKECPRERSSIEIELDLNGEPVYRGELKPSGLSRDGMAYVYETFVVSAGPQILDLRMRDDAKTVGFDYVRTAEVMLEPGQLLVIDFSAEAHKFVLSR